MTLRKGRFTIENTDDLVVFLIGARINKWWLLPIALPILATFPRMLSELSKDPNSGLLGFQSLGIGGTVQYWKSVEHLNRYANDRSKLHQPAWLRYMRKLFSNGAAGVWHETFIVNRGRYESIYTNMPLFGMGKFKPLLPATGMRNTASKRLGEPEPAASEG